MQCTGHDIQAQPINFCVLENCEPNSRQWVTSVQKLTTDQGPDQLVMIVPQGKLPVENPMAVGATFKIVTFVLRSGSHLVRNISQKGLTNIKSLPHYHDNPTKRSLQIRAEGVRKGVGKIRGGRDTREKVVRIN